MNTKLDKYTPFSTISLTKASSHFNASHLVLTQNYEEGIHGHNYHVEVEVRGVIDETGMVIDFIHLDRLVHNIIGSWDHYTLLPNKNPNVRISENGPNLDLSFGSRSYSIPRNEIKLLDCNNVTAEHLTRLIALKLCDEFKKYHIIAVERIIVRIWETAIYQATFSTDYKLE